MTTGNSSERACNNVGRKTTMPKGIKCKTPGTMKYYCIDHCFKNGCHTEFDMNYCNCKNNFITKKNLFSKTTKILKLIGVENSDKLCNKCETSCQNKNNGIFQSLPNDKIINCDRKSNSNSLFRSGKKERRVKKPHAQSRFDFTLFIKTIKNCIFP